MNRILIVVAVAGIAAGVRADKVNLFNGKDLAGWTSVIDHDVTGGYAATEPTWFPKGGSVFSTGTPFGYLRTKRSDYADFRLHIEFRWWRKTEKPNSGVFVRLSQERGAFIPSCVENQLQQGLVGDVIGLAGVGLGGLVPRDPYDPAKPLSGIAVSPRKGESVEKPFGEWNEMEIELKGDMLVNRVNGVELNRVSGISVVRGAIALQSEGGAIEFRNVWIEEAKDARAEAFAAVRERVQKRAARDGETYDRATLREIEILYRKASDSDGADEALKTLIEKFPKANRTGCAVMYAAQREKDVAERERLLKLAIDKFGDCYYGDGVQVGAYARYYLAGHCSQAGRTAEAEKLYAEIRTDYPDAVNHKGGLLSAWLPK